MRKNEKTIYTYAGYPLIPFKEFKEKALEQAARNIYNELRGYLSKDISPVEFIEFVKKAADAAEKIVEEKKRRAGGTGFQPIDGDLQKIPEFVETVRLITKMMPEEYLGTPQKPKFSKAEKPAEGPKTQTNPSIIDFEAQKLLGILNGLKYVGYSKEAVQSAVDDMVKRAEEFTEKGELKALGLYLWTARLLREGRFNDAEKFLRKES